ncbi:hypothetical protein ACP70R_032360 [Stipagrostis hirtigluma subsp. patula]
METEMSRLWNGWPSQLPCAALNSKLLAPPVVGRVVSLGNGLASSNASVTLGRPRAQEPPRMAREQILGNNTSTTIYLYLSLTQWRCDLSLSYQPFLRENSKLKKFRAKSFPLFNYLATLYEGSIATGDLNFTSTEAPLQPTLTRSEAVVPTDIDASDANLNQIFANQEVQGASSSHNLDEKEPAASTCSGQKDDDVLVLDKRMMMLERKESKVKWQEFYRTTWISRKSNPESSWMNLMKHQSQKMTILSRSASIFWNRLKNCQMRRKQWQQCLQV